MIKKVLICDDHYDFFEMLKFFMDEYFEKERVEVSFSPNGLDALLSSSKKEYDLIISDFKMPGMDGVEFINKVRSVSESQNKKTPILMFSAYKPELSFLDDGPDSITFMSKPFNSERLMSYVQEKFDTH